MSITFKLINGVNDQRIVEINKQLKEDGLPKLKFSTSKNIQDWLDDINQNSDSPQAHLKPADRDMTMEELKQCFPAYTNAGWLEVDGDKLSLAQKTRLLNLLDKEPFLFSIEVHGDYLSAMIKEVNVSGNENNNFSRLTSLLELEVEPELNLNRSIDIQDGVATLSYWNNNTVNVIFARVDEPTFLKEDKYVNEDYNSIYRDKKGKAYLCLPLLALGAQANENIVKIFDKAWNLGVRTNSYLFCAGVYGMLPINSKDLKKASKEGTALEVLQALNKINTLISDSPMLISVEGKFKYAGQKENQIDQKRKAVIVFAESLKNDHGFSEEEVLNIVQEKKYGSNRQVELQDQYIEKSAQSETDLNEEIGFKM